jgi:phospholipid N-methyltransferase
MATLDWLKTAFAHGFSSGNIASPFPNLRRWRSEKQIGGSYRKVLAKGILPYVRQNSVVLEIGPGRGSWTCALLKSVSTCVMHVVDVHDVTQWLQPEKYDGRLKCHVVSDNNGYSIFPDQYFDFCFSFGVLCHMSIESIEEILRNTLPKMKLGGYAMHQYGDWEKLDAFGWKKGGVPDDFRDKPDNEIWWPRNSKQAAVAAATRAGWTVVSPDLQLVKRDSIILLQRTRKTHHA